MVGIILIGHGEMVGGMLKSAKMFFDETKMKQVTSVMLFPEDNIEEFNDKLLKAIEEVNSDDGVIVLADLLGGTPCNCCADKINDKIQMITGINLSMLLEILCLRENTDLNIDSLIETGKNAIVWYNKLIKENT